MRNNQGGRFTSIATLVGLIALAVLWYLMTLPFISPVPWTGERASPDALSRHVHRLALELPPRGDDPRALAASAAYVFDEFRQYGDPQYQEFEVRGATYKNVLLRFESSAAKKIVVGAHYDAYAGLPGADDNASGTAGVLELARLIAAKRPGIDIELIAYALEEPPYFATKDMGSHHHAMQDDADLAIVLEMIGYFSDEAGSQQYSVPFLKHLYSDVGDFIALVGRFEELFAVRTMKAAMQGAADVNVHSLTFAPILPGVTLSDHRNYWALGKKAIMVTDTAFERNPYYHTQDDTPDKLNYRKMAEVITGVYASLFALAEGL